MFINFKYSTLLILIISLNSLKVNFLIEKAGLLRPLLLLLFLFYRSTNIKIKYIIMYFLLKTVELIKNKSRH